MGNVWKCGKNLSERLSISTMRDFALPDHLIKVAVETVNHSFETSAKFLNFRTQLSPDNGGLGRSIDVIISTSLEGLCLFVTKSDADKL